MYKNTAILFSQKCDVNILDLKYFAIEKNINEGDRHKKAPKMTSMPKIFSNSQNVFEISHQK